MPNCRRRRPSQGAKGEKEEKGRHLELCKRLNSLRRNEEE